MDRRNIYIALLVCLIGALSYQLYTCHMEKIRIQEELIRELIRRNTELMNKGEELLLDTCPVCPNNPLRHYVDSLY